MSIDIDRLSRQEFERHLKSMGQAYSPHQVNGEYKGQRVKELWATWCAGQRSMESVIRALVSLLAPNLLIPSHSTGTSSDPGGEVGIKSAESRAGTGLAAGGGALARCAAARDGDCTRAQCPQLRDNEPHASGRHCPLDTQDEDD